MAYEFPPDLNQLVKERMASGRYASEDDLLREALHALTDEQADWQAIQDAVDALAAGDPGVDLDEAFDAVRRRHHGAMP